MPNTLPFTRCYGASIGPVPSLPPLPQLPVSLKQPNQTLEDVCNFYSNSITSREASVQPLESDPAFFFRAFVDIDASPPPLNMHLQMNPPNTESTQQQLLPPSTADENAFLIWRDARILQETPHSHHRPCALSPLLSMLPSEIMSAGALTTNTIIVTYWFWVILCSQCYRGSLPETKPKSSMKARYIGTALAP